jgi:putative DNA primase/helicase
MATNRRPTSGTTEAAQRPRLALVQGPGRRAAIDAGEGDLAQLAEVTWDILTTANEPPILFRRGGEVVRLVADDDGGVRIQAVTIHALRHHLARVARWLNDGEPTPPPAHLVNDMLAHPDPPLPILERITGAPVFAADGTLGPAPGYHAGSRSYYHPSHGVALPEVSVRPTAKEIGRARRLIVEELLGDFPFVTEPDRAHAVALGLLPFSRALVAGPTPLHLVAKPNPGTGATLMAEVLTHIGTGGPASVMTEGRSEDEWRKRLTARLRGAPELVLIDNVRARLSSASLASAITSRMWEDRLLGLSRTIRLPVRCTWVATANNPVVSEEIARRSVSITMDTGTDRPWLRTRFRHPDLQGWVDEHRPELLWAFLTLTQAWLAAGRPRGTAPRLGMFESWTETIGGVLEVAGVEGFLGNLENVYLRSDRERAAWDAFMTAWWDRHGAAGVPVATLQSVASELLDLGDGGDRSKSTKLGILLAQHQDRLSGQLRVVRSEHDRRGAALWKLIAIGQAT